MILALLFLFNRIARSVIHSSGFSEDNEDQVSRLSIKTSRDDGIKIYTSGTTQTTTNWRRGIHARNMPVGGYFNVGVLGNANSNTTLSGRAYGVIGSAGNTTSGYNYGVLGILSGSRYGAAICGTVASDYGGYVPGIYAGYFNGNVLVTGTINGVLLGTSDIRLKENIVELNSQKALNNLLKMNPIEYNFKQTYEEVQSDTGMIQAKFFDESSIIYQKKQYGLSAQELKEIYPELVYEQDNGYLAVNYTGLIPVLI